MRNLENKFMIKVTINEEETVHLIVETNDGCYPNHKTLEKRLNAYVKKYMGGVLGHYEMHSIKPLLKALKEDFDNLTPIKN